MTLEWCQLSKMQFFQTVLHIVPETGLGWTTKNVLFSRLVENQRFLHHEKAGASKLTFISIMSQADLNFCHFNRNFWYFFHIGTSESSNCFDILSAGNYISKKIVFLFSLLAKNGAYDEAVSIRLLVFWAWDILVFVFMAPAAVTCSNCCAQTTGHSNRLSIVFCSWESDPKIQTVDWIASALIKELVNFLQLLIDRRL